MSKPASLFLDPKRETARPGRIRLNTGIAACRGGSKGGRSLDPLGKIRLEHWARQGAEGRKGVGIGGTLPPNEASALIPSPWADRDRPVYFPAVTAAAADSALNAV
jgi:hypothetical protein